MNKFFSDVIMKKNNTEDTRILNFKSDLINFAIEPKTVEKIKGICTEKNVPFFTFFITALKTVLYRYTWEEEISVSLMEQGEVQQLTSFLEGEKSFKTVLEEVEENISKAEKYSLCGDKHLNIVFRSKVQSEVNGETTFNIRCTLNEKTDGLDICFEYNIKEIERATIERFIAHFTKVIESVSASIDIKLCEIDILSQEEKELLLKGFNNNEMPFPSHKTILDLFEEQVIRYPNKISVKFENEQVTYGQLNERVNRLANYLKKNGVGKESIVVLLMERSINMIESVLAIWKAGGAYIPVDITYPEERLRVILEESGSRVVLTMSQYASENLFRDNAGRIIKLDKVIDEVTKESSENFDTGVTPGNLAYVIFTSGSTGKPKGAMVEHIGMLNHMFAKVNDLKLDDGSIIANNASHCFDISVWQMFCALIAGGTTIIYSNDLVLNPDEFIDTVIEDKVNILEVVPSFLSAMLERLEHKNRRFPEIKYLLVTGETVKPNLVRKWFEMYSGIKMVNAYGPTEASDDITHYIMDNDPGVENIPIGKPIQNFNIYIVDNWMNLCPVGVAGEICVSGIGVGRGYVNNPEKTKEVFMKDPFNKGVDRLYKTGDLGRWTKDGLIDFMGRKDFQVKVRGFRIELGEIEAALEKHQSVKQSVVIVREDIPGDKRITAYLEGASEKAPEISELRQFLEQVLPDYMIPAAFVHMEKLPLNSNGKIDRRALPVPDISRNDIEGFIAPQTPLQKEIAEIWEKLFDFAPIGLDDDFLELGGHSLLATQLVFRLNEHFNISVPLKQVLTKGRTIRELTGIVEELLLGQMDVNEIQEMLQELEGLSEEEIMALLEEKV